MHKPSERLRRAGQITMQQPTITSAASLCRVARLGIPLDIPEHRYPQMRPWVVACKRELEREGRSILVDNIRLILEEHDRRYRVGS